MKEKNKLVGNGETQETGNPVSSIDNVINKFKNEICKNNIQKKFIDKFGDFYKLQNGVETDNGRPKSSKERRYDSDVTHGI